MAPTTPPPFAKPQRSSRIRGDSLLFGLSLIPGLCISALIVLRLFGLLRPFSMPTGSMTPAISPGDYVVMEGITFLVRKPRRGDIVVFKTDGIRGLHAGSLYMKRIAGLPSDHLRISEGKLFVNNKRLALSNAMGEIAYYPPSQAEASKLMTDMVVPMGCYFVLGDNSTNSLDSRYFGSLPRDNIIGRIFYCYWPPKRLGGVK
jgi:signal peptidase I